MATLEQNDLDGSLPKGDFRRETEFLERIVSRSEFTRFSKETKTEEPEQVVKIVDTGQSIEESLCPKNGTVVTISDNAMYGWNRPNFDRGPLPMNRWRIDGLFGFMTQIVWPRFVCDQSAARLMRMKYPDHVRNILVSYMPVPGSLGEMKTKPTQQAVRTMMAIKIRVFTGGLLRLPQGRFRRC